MRISSVYLPKHETPTPWGLDLHGSGYAHIAPGQEYPPREHPEPHYFQWDRGRSLTEYQFIFVSQGSGVIETHLTEPRSLKAPFGFLLFPNVWHRYRPASETGWKEHWIAFDGHYARELQSSGVIAPESPFFEIGHNEQILAQLQLIHEEATTESLGHRRLCSSAIMQILALATILPQRRQEERHPMRKVIRQACFLMRERAEQALSPEDLAKELHVGYTNFRRMFKSFTGMSPSRYHSQLRLLRAKSLLRDTNLGVSEVAHALGFDTPFHFSSWFKKQTGQAPSSWPPVA